MNQLKLRLGLDDLFLLASQFNDCILGRKQHHVCGGKALQMSIAISLVLVIFL